MRIQDKKVSKQAEQVRAELLLSRLANDNLAIAVKRKPAGQMSVISK